MPRCPAKDYADRCQAVVLDEQGMKRCEIARALHRPDRWVRRTLRRYDPQVGLESLRDHSSRPHHSPQQTSPQVEKAICKMKKAHPHWGRRQICKQLRCHSACADQPPATRYQPSSRPFPPDFDLTQVPITFRPTVVTRQVQASGRVSLAGSDLPFSSRYRGQSITVTVDGWFAVAQAQDGWQRVWDLHPGAKCPSPSPLPPPLPHSLSRKVSSRGCITINRFLYYLGIAWSGQTVDIQSEQDAWSVPLPDGSVKILPKKDTLSAPHTPPAPSRLSSPPHQQPETFQTRRVTCIGQISFHNRLYYAGIAHRGQSVLVTPIPQGLAIYTTDPAWITTCPWHPYDQPDKPLCPT